MRPKSRKTKAKADEVRGFHFVSMSYEILISLSV